MTEDSIVLPLTATVGMPFVRIPSGSFLMGTRGFYADEEPPHRVVLADDFWMSRTPVTQRQFAVWTRSCGITHENGFSGDLDLPAESMDWDKARAYCQWLTEKMDGIKHERLSGHVATLPTEAQWEYACRAGCPSEYHSGDGEAALQRAGWYDRTADNKTHAVAEKEPNDWGLHDMHGNVWEWCLDAWDPEAYRKRADGVVDPYVSTAAAPAADEDSRVKVLRSWITGLEAIRDGWDESHRPAVQQLEELSRGEVERGIGDAFWRPIARASGKFLGGAALDEDDFAALRGAEPVIGRQIPDTGGLPARVVRGGGWGAMARNCRSAYRIGGAPTVRDWGRGFRVCLVSGSVVPPDI